MKSRSPAYFAGTCLVLTLLQGCFGGSSGSSSSAPPSTTSGCDESSLSDTPDGSVTTGPSSSFVPLCDGKVLIGDTSTNKVIELNALTGAESTSFQLSATPEDLVLDETNNLLYSGLASATSIAEVNLTSSVVGEIAVSGGSPENLALGPSGYVFVTINTGSGYTGPIDYVDGLTQTQVSEISGSYDYLIAYDSASSQVFTAGEGVSPSPLTRYSFNSGTNTLTQEQQISDAGGNGNTIVVSPQGSQLAYVDGAGNGSPPYTIFDYSPSNLSSVAGNWSTGAYPSGGAFSPDGSYFASSDGLNDVILFDASTHAVVKTLSLTLCEYGEITSVKFSEGGKLLFAYTNCGDPSSSGTLYWTSVP